MKSACQTISTGQASRPGPEAEANMGRAPDAPPTEDADGLSTTNSEVESAMNHRRRRTVLRDACFFQEALDAFNTGDAYLRAAQNGLARATEQYVKDIRVSEGYICQQPPRLETVKITDLRIICYAGSYKKEHATVPGAGRVKSPT